jgi:hypothetical protein
MTRWWGIRHLRYWWYARQVARWARYWGEHGIGIGVPHQADLVVLDAIWRGER